MATLLHGLPYLAGSLFLLATALLLWQIGTLWLRHPRYLFFPALFLVGAVGAGVGYALALQATLGWVYLLAAAAIVSGTVGWLLYRFHPTRAHRLPLAAIAVYGVVVLLFAPALLIFSYRYHQAVAVAANEDTYLNAQSRLQNGLDRVSTAVDQVAASDPTTLPNLQRALLDQQLGFLALVNAQGIIQLRADQPESIGHRLSGYGWSDSPAASKSLLALDERGQAVAVRIAPLPGHPDLFLVGGSAAEQFLPPSAALASTEGLVAVPPKSSFSGVQASTALAEWLTSLSGLASPRPQALLTTSRRILVTAYPLDPSFSARPPLLLLTFADAPGHW